MTSVVSATLTAGLSIVVHIAYVITDLNSAVDASHVMDRVEKPLDKSIGANL